MVPNHASYQGQPGAQEPSSLDKLARAQRQFSSPRNVLLDERIVLVAPRSLPTLGSSLSSRPTFFFSPKELLLSQDFRSLVHRNLSPRPRLVLLAERISLVSRLLVLRRNHPLLRNHCLSSWSHCSCPRNRSPRLRNCFRLKNCSR